MFKRRYRGKLIHSISDDFGLIEVIEDATHRSLHFGSKEKQSSMALDNPITLALSYTRAMMISLLFAENPQSILCIGLGGGSIPKFMNHHYPDCQVDIVELREAVTRIAHQYFDLPFNNNINIFIADVKKYFQHKLSSKYDMIFLDAFDQDGLSDSVKGYSFIEACKSRLNPNGILVMNLWSEPEKLFEKIVYGARKSFHKQSFVLPVADRSNQILVACNMDNMPFNSSYMMDRARELESKTLVGFPELIRTLVKEYRLV